VILQVTHYLAHLPAPHFQAFHFDHVAAGYITSKLLTLFQGEIIEYHIEHIG